MFKECEPIQIQRDYERKTNGYDHICANCGNPRGQHYSHGTIVCCTPEEKLELSWKPKPKDFTNPI